MSSETIYLGIDPGKSGGMAAMYQSGSVISVEPWKGEAEAHEFIAKVRDEADISFRGCSVEAAIERVGGFIRPPRAAGGGDVKGGVAGSSQAFKFGENYGWLRGLLAGLHIAYCQVLPRTWQTGLMIPACEGANRKRAIRDIAKQKFPTARVTLKTADALLIADWLRRQSVRELKSA